MSKLIRHIFILLFVTTVGAKTHAQIRRFVPAPLRPGNDAPNTGRFMPQKNGATGSKLEAARNRFLSEQLNLSDEQAYRFWPMYQKYQQELVTVRRLKRLNNSNAAANGTEQIDKENYYETQIVTIRKRYKDAFLKILPPEKVSLLYKSEQEFNDELIKRLSEPSERAGN